jgi:hypothetical protein
MKKFGKPAVGSQITVKTQFSNLLKGYSPLIPREGSKSGVVVKSERFDDVDSFRLATGRQGFPISIISLDHVVDIVYSDGTVAEKVDKTQISVAKWEVKSSSRKGGSYTVTLANGHYECGCAGFTFRKSCRHINEVKTKLGA